MKCLECGKPMTADKARQHIKKFCSNNCCARYHYRQKKNFEAEWEAWKRDFAAGRTDSNL